MANIGYGTFGFSITKEVEPGVYEEVIEEKEMYYNILKDNFAQTDNNNSNQDISFNKTISVLYSDYLQKNISHLRYVEFMGIKVNVRSVSPNYPRLTLSLGGFYND